MGRRSVLAFSGVVVLASWGICVFQYATEGGGAYDEGAFTAFVLVAAILTIVGATLVVSSWRGGASVLVAALVSGFAAASILWLALAIGLRG